MPVTKYVDAAMLEGASRPRLLYASAELHPLIKTGGLADVAAALPDALQQQGADISIVIPAYRGALRRAGRVEMLGELQVLGRHISVFSARHPQTAVPVLLLSEPTLFDRDGDPYHDAQGQAFADNAFRFGVFCQAIAVLAAHGCGSLRGFDLVHLNDWQTGLAAVHLARRPRPIPSVFTIHNLAHQGLFAESEFHALQLDPALWHQDAIEALGCLSFMKAGLVFAQAITTVSPQYAKEIVGPEFGHGLDSLLRMRGADLHGIVNGIDQREWNPALDPHISHRFDQSSLSRGKANNRHALRAAFGLPERDVPVMGFIGRLAAQKGVDALLDAAGGLSELPVQIVILGSGEQHLQQRCLDWAQWRPQQVAYRSCLDEGLAHQLVAGADMLIMPSRFEPCGLVQMYAQRYGSVPLVRRVGGLVDTVADIAEVNGSGIHFEHCDAGGVLYAVKRALELFAQPERWMLVQAQGMNRDFSWGHSAQAHCQLYRRLVA